MGPVHGCEGERSERSFWGALGRQPDNRFLRSLLVTVLFLGGAWLAVTLREQPRRDLLSVARSPWKLTLFSPLTPSSVNFQGTPPSILRAHGLPRSSLFFSPNTLG